MWCFGREEDSQRLWQLLNDGKNVLMLAPRRLGKTVLLNSLYEQRQPHGFQAIVVEVAGFTDEKGFLREICAVLQQETALHPEFMTTLTARLHRAFNASPADDWRQVLQQSDWQSFADQLLAHLEESGRDVPWLLLLDELPIFLLDLLHHDGGAERVHAFLYTLRRLRQKHRRVRWVFAGSIGLDTVARRRGVEGALADLVSYELKPFSPTTAMAFLQALAHNNKRTLDIGSCAVIVDRLGWLAPYYLEKLMDEALAAAGTGAVDDNCAAMAAEALLSLSRRIYWTNWREHLDKNFADPERTRLFMLLAAIARAPFPGPTTDTLLAHFNAGGEPISERALSALLDTLQADGYLIADSGPPRRWRFQMGLLRDWWLRYVVT